MADYGEYGDFEEFDWEMQELAEELEAQKNQKKGGTMALQALRGTDSLIFDIDGTLWDSRAQVAKAWNEVIAKKSTVDMRVDEESLKQLFGKTMTEISRLLFPNLEDPERMELTDACYAYENELLAKEPASLYPYVEQTLKTLAGTYPLFIVSNCQRGYIELCIKGSHIAPYITDYACFGDTGLPKSETIALIVERNQLKHPVYIGDTKGDEEACRAANIPVIFASYGFGEMEHPAAVIRRFDDLLKLFQV